MTVRTGERTATLFGTGSLLVSMILFATLGPPPGWSVILVALALSGLGMGVSMPATSATMSNELAASEYGVMSAAQLLAAQVGEVAGIQAVLTIQESIAKRSGLGNVHHSPALLHSFSVPFWVGTVRGRVGRALRAVHPAAAAARCAAGAAGSPTPAEPTGRYSVMSRKRRGHLGRLGVGSPRAPPAAPSAWPCRPRRAPCPAMKACMPAWGLPSMRIALAVS